MIAFWIVEKIELIYSNFDQAFTYAEFKSKTHMEMPFGHNNPGNNSVFKSTANFHGITDRNLV